MTVVGVQETDSSAVHVSREEGHPEPLCKGQLLSLEDEPVAFLLVVFGAPVVVADGVRRGAWGRSADEHKREQVGYTTHHSQVIQQLGVFVESKRVITLSGDGGIRECLIAHLLEKPPNPLGESLPMRLSGFNLLSRKCSTIDMRG
jgi:hypothetical protein